MKIGKYKLTFEKRQSVSKWFNLLLPVLSILFALCIGAIFLFFNGHSPIAVYGMMLKGSFGSSYGFGETVVKAIPLILIGLGVAIAFRMLMWNIGAEGQFYMGTFAASGVALSFPDAPGFILLPAMVVAGFLGGALWALVAAIPKAVLGVNEVIVTLMLNYVAILWVEYLVYGPWKDPQGLGFPLSAPFSSGAILPTFGNTRIHFGLVFALLAAIAVYYLIQRTKWGYEIRVIGESQQTAKYAGMNIFRNMLIVMAISGGLAGIAGMAEVSGVAHRLQRGLSPGYGYTAIIVAWLARLHPAGIVVVGFFFAALLVGGYSMQMSGIPMALVSMIQGFILFSILGFQFFSKYQVKVVGEGEVASGR